MRPRVLGWALAGATLALALASCAGDLEDTDDAETQRNGTGGTPGSGATSTGGQYNPCASFSPWTTTTCFQILPVAGGEGGEGGEADSPGAGGASAGSGRVPTTEECRQSPLFGCSGTPRGISVQGDLCCFECFHYVCG
jgi:hypothetical protein